MIEADVKDLTRIDKVIDIAKEISGLDITDKCRVDEYVTVRMACYKILKELGFTYYQIAEKFNRNHASVIHGLKSYQILESQNKKIRMYYRMILDKLTQLPDDIYLDKLYEKNYLGYLEELDDLKQKVSQLQDRVKYYEEFADEIGGEMYTLKKLQRTNKEFSDKFEAFWNINKKVYLTKN